ncbi:unnamed protein product (mitochondrion) [Plasmodiophora brassicae]|uniref:Tyrosine-protein kinase ephrin type A/B receptor-like domain-containing protein n=1 Tax=Plasmodiophora brassicae TaxID=37360 RepID=A0A3P3Y960_PLABS|nr:unnamed protein product [Plasmodiophora brassicae]
MASNPSTAGPRSSVGQACVTCPIGTFGADPQRLQCRTCTPGYICLQGCTSATPQTVAEDNGYPCPAGSYCVNSTATPCPAGSFSPAPAGADRSACQPCAQGTYSALPGQVGCRQCGSSALSTSTSGATGCQCAGKHRAYQAADATCQCVPGYTSLDGAIDGISDCYPIVYPSSCPSGTVLSNSGQCTSTDCNSTCNGPGTFDPTYSICNCDHANRVACDEACRATAPSTQICNGTSICITNPATGATTVTPLSSLPGYSGNVQCPSGTNCNTVMFVAGGDGQKAVYGIPPVLQTTSTLPAARSTTKAPMRMLLSFDSDRNRWEALEASSTTSPAASALPGYTSPTVCLSQYDSLVFDLSAGPTHYPVYDKDNLLNTNPNFDWSSFRLLASQANADPGSIQVFAFTFTTAGTYVFYDNADRSKVTTAVVAPDGVSCPSGGAIMGTTPQNLVQLGVIRSTNLLTTPNLMTIVYLVGAFISALVIVYVYSKFRAKTMSLKGYDFVGGDTSHVASDIVALKQALAEHRDDERKMFEKQKCDIEAMVVKIGAESEQLKALLAVKLSGPTTSSLFLDVAERLMAGELAARRSYERRQVRVEADIDDRLKQLDTAASAIVDAGPDAAQDVNRVQRAARDVCERISTWNSLVTTERHRRQTIVEHIGTIGERAAQVFTAHDGDEDRAEDALRDALAACSSAVQRVSASLTGICDQFAARHLELMQARNASALAQLTSRHRVQQVSVCRELRTGLQRTFAQLRTASAALSSARQTCRRSNESGCEVVRQERRKLEAEQRARATTADGDGRAARTVQTGLFAGLHSGLAAALEQMIGGPHALLDLEQALEARRADEDADSSSATSREHAGRQWDGRAQMDAALDDEWRRRLLKIEDVRLQAISSSDAVQRGNEAARRLRRDVMRHRLRAALFAAVLLRDRNVDRRLAQQRDSNAQQERANAYAKIEEWYEAQREADLAAILKLEHAGKGPEEMAQLQQAMRSADLCATEDAGGPVEVDPVSEEEVEMRREHNRVLREIRLRQQVEAESGPSVDARDHERELNREMRAMDRELMDLRSKQMRKLERQQLDEMEVDKVSKQVITDVLSRRHLHEAIGAVRLLFADLCDIALCDDADPDRVVAALSYNATRIIAVHNAHVDEVTQERGRFCIPTNDLNEERATFAADVNALLKRLVDSIATEHRERQEDAVRTARLESAMKVIEEGLAQEREHFDRESNSEQAWQRLLDKQQGIRERNLATIRAQVNAELRAQREAGALKLMPVPEDPIGTGAEEALQLGSVLDTGAIKSKLESIEGALCRFVEGRGSFEHPLNSSSTLAIGHIVVADLATVSAPVFLCHRLGQALVSLLSVSTPHVSLQLVTRLPRPSPALASNPFSNLFLYDPVDRVLSVRDEVAGDVGDFAMVVVHTLAHIRSEDWTETGPVFLRELLVLVRLLSLQALTNGSPLPALSTRDAMSAYVDLRRARDLADQYAQDARFLDRLEQYRSVVNNAAIQEHIAATMKSLPASVLPVQLPDAARRNETTLDSSHLLGQVDDAHGDLLSILTEAHQLSRTVTDLDMNADGSMATQETLSAARDRLHRLHLHKVDIANKLAILERLCASLTQ